MLTPSLPTEAPTGLPLSARRRIQAGMVVATAAGVPRTGILSASASPLVTGTTDPTMTYRIAPFVGASSRDGIGVEFVANDASDVAQSAVAPSANSRIDVIWFRSRFPSLTDSAGQNSPVFGVTRGTADANPQKPTNVPAGAEELATAVVTSSDLATQTVVITQTARLTAFAGGIVPVRTLAELNAWAPPVGSFSTRLDIPGSLYERTSAGWVAVLVPSTSFVPNWENLIVGSPGANGSGSNTGLYSVAAGRCRGEARTQLGAGYALSDLNVRLIPPVAPAPPILADTPVGQVVVLNSGTGWVAGWLMMTTTGRLELRTDGNPYSGFVTGANGGAPFPLAVDDVISVSFDYRV